MPKCDFNKAEIAKLKLLLQDCLLRFICLSKVTKTGTKSKHLRSIRCVRSVRIWSYSGLYFPHSDWIWKDPEWKNAAKYGPERLRIRALFRQ